jgi:hypothetical protein
MICRIDMIELFIKNNGHNRAIFSVKELVSELDELIKEPGEMYRIGNRRRLNFENKIVRVTLLMPIRESNNDLLRIRISNRCKWAWEDYHLYINPIGYILDYLKLDYAISKVEIAFDTLCEEVARQFHQTVSLKWGRPDKLFNYKRHRQRAGGSPDGQEEYMFGRCSPRQTHTYTKEYTDTTYGPKTTEVLFRWELKLRRKYLRSKGIHTIHELFAHSVDLVQGLLTFKRLNRRKLNRELRRAKDWRLSGKSIAEQYRMMHRNGLTRKEIDSYFESTSSPDIIYTILDPDDMNLDFDVGDALWGAYVSLKLSREGITKGRIK